MELSSEEKWIFIGLICLACKSDNRIPYDKKWLDRTLNTKNIEIHIEKLTKCDLLSICYQNDIPIREEEIREDKKREDKSKHLDFVFLFPVEYESLVKEIGESKTTEMIKSLNDYIGSTGKKYKSHYHTILNWVRMESKRGIFKKPELSNALHAPKGKYDGTF